MCDLLNMTDEIGESEQNIEPRYGFAPACPTEWNEAIHWA